MARRKNPMDGTMDALLSVAAEEGADRLYDLLLHHHPIVPALGRSGYGLHIAVLGDMEYNEHAIYCEFCEEDHVVTGVHVVLAVVDWGD